MDQPLEKSAELSNWFDIVIILILYRSCLPAIERESGIVSNSFHCIKIHFVSKRRSKFCFRYLRVPC